MGSFEIWGHGPFGPPSNMEQQPHQPYQAQAPHAPLLGYRLGPIGQPVPSAYPSEPRTYIAPKNSSITYCSSQLGGFNMDVEPVGRSGGLLSAPNPWDSSLPEWHFGTLEFHGYAQMKDCLLRYPEDDDHPSFARPPHRPIEKPKPQQAPSHFVEFVSIPSPDSAIKDFEIVVPNSYPVPAPPPLAQSAAPLSDFAAELVWNRCFVRQIVPRKQLLIPYGNDFNTFPSIWMSRASADNRDGRNMIESPGSGNFGAIGVEVKTRRAASRENACGRPSLASVTAATSKAGVKPAFRRWCKQVLEATLLSPQVLMLAMMYVDAVTEIDVFGESKNQMTPYKMMIAALVLANKTLDDHSYKNSTFANVSSMTNAEVNNVEIALLLALDFNTVPQNDEWISWLHVAIEFGDRTGFKLTGTKVDDLIPALLATYKTDVVEPIDMPKTPLFLPRTVSCFYREACKDALIRRGRMTSFCGICKGGSQGSSNPTFQRRFGQELSFNQLAIASF